MRVPRFPLTAFHEGKSWEKWLGEYVRGLDKNNEKARKMCGVRRRVTVQGKEGAIRWCLAVLRRFAGGDLGFKAYVPGLGKKTR